MLMSRVSAGFECPISRRLSDRTRVLPDPVSEKMVLEVEGSSMGSCSLLMCSKVRLAAIGRPSASEKDDAQDREPMKEP